jgi:hypothetical protein
MNFLTSSEKIEHIFEKYFQKTIVLSVKDEVIKRGKFLLIKNCIISNNYFFEFTIERAKKLDIVKIPYPFNLEECPTDNLIYMDYRVSSLFNNDRLLVESINTWIEKLELKNQSKFLNSILEIRFE